MNELLEQAYNQSFKDELNKISELTPEKKKILNDYKESVKNLKGPEYPFFHKYRIPEILGGIGGATVGVIAEKAFNKRYPKYIDLKNPIASSFSLGGIIAGGVLSKDTLYRRKINELKLKRKDDLKKIQQ
jgi:hypothetical protein